MPAPVKVFADYFVANSQPGADDIEPSLRAMPNGRLGLIWSSNFAFSTAAPIAGSGGSGNSLGGVGVQISQAFTPAGYRLMTWVVGAGSIQAQAFASSVGNFGTPVSSVVPVGLSASGQVQPQTVALGEGRFMVAWVDLQAQRIPVWEVSSGGDIALYSNGINVGAVNQNFDFGLTVLTNGNVVLAYRLNSFDAVFRVLAPGGFVTGEIDYDGVAGGTGLSTVCALADGRFVVLTRDANGNGDISGRIFNANGTLSVPEFNVLAGGDIPKAISLPDGRFFVINGSGGDLNGELFGQMMKPDGSKDGGVVAINTVTAGTQTNADLTLLPDGRIAIAWQTNELGNNDIKLTILDPRETGIELAGTPLDDNYVGSAFADLIAAGEGNDVIDGAGEDDILSGGNGADILIGGSGNDTLSGGQGNDVLVGGPGSDTLSGGSGNDAFYVDSADDRVFDAAGGGDRDAVYTTVSYSLPANQYVEVLAANDAASLVGLTLTGNELAQDIAGTAGNDLLIGGGGADLLIGRGGNDVYVIGSATARIYEEANGGLDVVYTTVSYQLTAGHHIEALAANDAASTVGLTLIGNELAQDIAGTAGADVLIGGGGADLLIGRGGNDVYVISGSTARVYEEAGGGFDVVYTMSNHQLTPGHHVEVLAANNAASNAGLTLIGNELAQDIAGTAGADLLIGGGGADLLVGRGGNDVYIVTDAAARVYEEAGGGQDVVYARASYALTAGHHIEALAADDAASIVGLSLTGNEFSQDIAGTAGADTLNGGGGADFLIGRGGADTFAFTTALGGGNVDRLYDMVSGVDRIALSNAVFTGLATGTLAAGAFRIGIAAQDADDRIIYDSATGALYFDSDGNGAAAAVQFATVAAGTALTATDFTVIGSGPASLETDPTPDELVRPGPDRGSAAGPDPSPVTAREADHLLVVNLLASDRDAAAYTSDPIILAPAGSLLPVGGAFETPFGI